MMVPLSVAHPGSGHVGPTILGHEFVGTVVDVGADAACGVDAGWPAARACHAAPAPGAARGRTNLCARYYTLGLSTHGGLARFVAAPAQHDLREIPDGCPDIEAALAQPLAVGLHGVARSGVRPGDTVVVLGAGAIGSFLLAGLSRSRRAGRWRRRGPGTARDGAGARGDRDAPGRRDGSPADLRALVPEGADVVIESSGAARLAPSARSRSPREAARCCWWG